MIELSQFHYDALCRLIEHGSEALIFATSPAYRVGPRLFVDGNQWCALLGENVQEGIVGFGDSPAEAYADFDRSWFAKLPIARKP